MDIETLLQQNNIQYAKGGGHHHVREGWVGIDCPWCGTLGKYHLGIHLATLRAYCWKCGRRNLVEALAMVTKRPAWQISKEVNSLSRPFVPRIDEQSGRDHNRRKEVSIPAGVGPLSAPHKRWLRSRGLDPKAMEQLWGLRGIGMAARLSWRIWVPVYFEGQLVSWTSRSVGSSATRRWIHAKPEEEAMPIKSILYGWDYVKNTAIVVEGASDVWRIGPGAVALFGMVASTSQLKLLSRIPRRVIVLDSEPAAQRAARKLAEQLSPFPGETYVVELESPDPGEASDKEIEELRRRFLD